MMKFFRRYTKHLLVVFMSLLLVVWLGGSALSSMLQERASGGDETVAKMFGKEVTRADMQPVLSSLEVLDRVAPDWKMIWLSAITRLGIEDTRLLQQFMQQIRIGEDRQPEMLTGAEWFMLLRSAEKSGVYVPADAVETFKQQRGFTKDSLGGMAQSISTDQINQAIHSFLMVQEHAAMICNPLPLSEADIREYVQQANEKVRISAVLLPSIAYLDESYEPTEQELQAQFDEYKDVPSRPASGLEFGYEQPEAVAVEYVKISPQTLVEFQTVDEDSAFDYWSDHKNEFTRPVAETAPAGQRPKPQPYETFTEALPDVKQTIKEQKAERQATKLARDLLAQLRTGWDTMAEEDEASEQQRSAGSGDGDLFQNAASGFQQQFPNTLLLGKTDLLNRNDMNRLHPEFNRAVALRGTPETTTLAAAAFLVPPLAEKPESIAKQRIYRQLNETCELTFTDFDGNIYLMRTIEARPAQAPDNFEVIREQLVKDCRMKKAHEAAGEEAELLAEKAAATGSLENAIAEIEGLAGKLDEKPVKTPTPFSRMQAFSYPGMPPRLFPAMIEGIGRDEDLIDKCFQHADAEDVAEQFFAYDQLGNQRWVIVKTHEKIPVTDKQLADNRSVATEYYRNERLLSLVQNWFAAEQIESRVGWEAVEQPKDDEDGSEAEQDDAEPESAETADSAA